LSRSTRERSYKGQSVKIAVDGDKVEFNGANVMKTDLGANDGVIRVIDTVLLPNQRPARRNRPP